MDSEMEGTKSIDGMPGSETDSSKAKYDQKVKELHQYLPFIKIFIKMLENNGTIDELSNRKRITIRRMKDMYSFLTKQTRTTLEILQRQSAMLIEIHNKSKKNPFLSNYCVKNENLEDTIAISSDDDSDDNEIIPAAKPVNLDAKQEDKLTNTEESRTKIDDVKISVEPKSTEKLIKAKTNKYPDNRVKSKNGKKSKSKNKGNKSKTEKNKRLKTSKSINLTLQLYSDVSVDSNNGMDFLSDVSGSAESTNSYEEKGRSKKNDDHHYRDDKMYSKNVIKKKKKHRRHMHKKSNRKSKRYAAEMDSDDASSNNSSDKIREFKSELKYFMQKSMKYFGNNVNETSSSTSFSKRKSLEADKDDDDDDDDEEEESIKNDGNKKFSEKHKNDKITYLKELRELETHRKLSRHIDDLTDDSDNSNHDKSPIRNTIDYSDLLIDEHETVQQKKEHRIATAPELNDDESMPSIAASISNDQTNIPLCISVDSSDDADDDNKDGDDNTKKQTDNKNITEVTSVIRTINISSDEDEDDNDGIQKMNNEITESTSNNTIINLDDEDDDDHVNETPVLKAKIVETDSITATKNISIENTSTDTSPKNNNNNHLISIVSLLSKLNNNPPENNNNNRLTSIESLLSKSNNSPPENLINPLHIETNEQSPSKLSLEENNLSQNNSSTSSSSDLQLIIEENNSTTTTEIFEQENNTVISDEKLLFSRRPKVNENSTSTNASLHVPALVEKDILNNNEINKTLICKSVNEDDDHKVTELNLKPDTKELSVDTTNINNKDENSSKNMDLEEKNLKELHEIRFNLEKEMGITIHDLLPENDPQEVYEHTENESDICISNEFNQKGEVLPFHSPQYLSAVLPQAQMPVAQFLPVPPPYSTSLHLANINYPNQIHPNQIQTQAYVPAPILSPVTQFACSNTIQMGNNDFANISTIPVITKTPNFRPHINAKDPRLCNRLALMRNKGSSSNIPTYTNQHANGQPTTIDQQLDLQHPTITQSTTLPLQEPQTYGDYKRRKAEQEARLAEKNNIWSSNHNIKSLSEESKSRPEAPNKNKKVSPGGSKTKTSTTVSFKSLQDDKEKDNLMTSESGKVKVAMKKTSISKVKSNSLKCRKNRVIYSDSEESNEESDKTKSTEVVIQTQPVIESNPQILQGQGSAIDVNANLSSISSIPDIIIEPELLKKMFQEVMEKWIITGGRETLLKAIAAVGISSLKLEKIQEILMEKPNSDNQKEIVTGKDNHEDKTALEQVEQKEKKVTKPKKSSPSSSTSSKKKLSSTSQVNPPKDVMSSSSSPSSLTPKIPNSLKRKSKQLNPDRRDKLSLSHDSSDDDDFQPKSHHSSFLNAIQEEKQRAEDSVASIRAYIDNHSIYDDGDYDDGEITDDFEKFLQRKKSKTAEDNNSNTDPIVCKECTVSLVRLDPNLIKQYQRHLDDSSISSCSEYNNNQSDSIDLLRPLKSIPFVEKNRSGRGRKPKVYPNNTDKTQHCRSELAEKCTLCCKKRINIVQHYVNDHKNKEVYIARLPKKDIDRLERKTFTAKRMSQSSQDKSKPGYSSKCIFCKKLFNNRLKSWYEHFTEHTGEYSYECTKCGQRNVSMPELIHYCGSDKEQGYRVSRVYRFDLDIREILAYRCFICNYVQLHKANIVKHLKKEHGLTSLDSEINVRELVLLKIPEKKQVQIVNEPIIIQPVQSLKSVQNINDMTESGGCDIDSYFNDDDDDDGDDDYEADDYNFNESISSAVLPVDFDTNIVKDEFVNDLSSIFEPKKKSVNNMSEDIFDILVSSDHDIDVKSDTSFVDGDRRNEEQNRSDAIAKDITQNLSLLNDLIDTDITTTAILTPTCTTMTNNSSPLNSESCLNNLIAFLESSIASESSSLGNNDQNIPSKESTNTTESSAIRKHVEQIIQEKSTENITSSVEKPKDSQNDVIVYVKPDMVLNSNISPSVVEMVPEQSIEKNYSHIDENTPTASCSSHVNSLTTPTTEITSNIRPSISEMIPEQSIERNSSPIDKTTSTESTNIDVSVSSPKTSITKTATTEVQQLPKCDNRIQNIGYKILHDNQIIYICLRSDCGYSTVIGAKPFYNHLLKHKNLWNGVCGICQKKVSVTKPGKIDEYEHMIKIHISKIRNRDALANMIPSQQQPEQSPSSLSSSPSSISSPIIAWNVLNVVKILKPWLKKSISKKSEDVCMKFITENNLCPFYKCMGNDCIFTTYSVEQFKQHISDHELQKDAETMLNRSWYECCYCDELFYDSLRLSSHINDKHASSIFQCSMCFYRCSSAYGAQVHQNKYHPTITEQQQLIYICEGRSQTFGSLEHMIIQLRETNVQPFICEICKAPYYAKQPFIDHIRREHPQYDASVLDKLPEYSCVYCPHQVMKEVKIIEHLVDKHPDMHLCACRRTSKEGFTYENCYADISCTELIRFENLVDKKLLKKVEHEKSNDASKNNEQIDDMHLLYDIPSTNGEDEHNKKNQEFSDLIEASNRDTGNLEKRLRCKNENCYQTFENKKTLEEHLDKCLTYNDDDRKKYLTEEDWQCKPCNQVFNEYSGIVDHMHNVHNATVWFKCYFCPFVKTEYREIKKHIILHHNDQSINVQTFFQTMTKISGNMNRKRPLDMPNLSPRKKLKISSSNELKQMPLLSPEVTDDSSVSRNILPPILQIEEQIPNNENQNIKRPCIRLVPLNQLLDPKFLPSNAPHNL